MEICMNNVYDTANKLAYEIKESKEYKDYKLARKKINENPELKAKIDEFENHCRINKRCANLNIGEHWGRG